MRDFAAFLREKLEEIPERPGVYIFRNAQGKPLYIGKAKNLRNRLRAYLNPGGHPRMEALHEKAEDLEVLVTGSEAEALILESNLIKELLPRYNIRLKDDRRYPYIKVTVGETFPGIYETRDTREKEGVVYFGPYPSARSIRKALRVLLRIFPLRTCHLKLPPNKWHSPCMEYHLGRCVAPCAFPLDPQEYRKLVNGALSYLSGRTREAEEVLEHQMKEAAEKLDFERAAFLRDQLMALRGTGRTHSITGTNAPNLDVLALARAGNLALVLVLPLREGRVVGKETFLLTADRTLRDEEVMGDFIASYYTPFVPGVQALIPLPHPEEPEEARQAFRERTGMDLPLRPPRFEEEGLCAIARENAERALDAELDRRARTKHGIHPALAELKELLHLERPPIRIECTDISQLFGAHPVGSVVVFENARPKKSEYRRFRIKGVKGIDDFAMIEEVVRRRLSRLVREGKPLPDLFLIDGGKGQLSHALAAARTLGVDDQVTFLAIAKRLDELHTVDGRVLMLPRRSPALRLLQRIRDEAHRFAVSYHRKLRSKEGIRSLLDQVPGIGEKRKRALIRYFGSAERVLSASPQELMRVPGIGPLIARKIYEHLQEGA